MSHTYSKIFVHTIFARKQRKKIISLEIQDRLTLAVGGVEDHVHLLLSLPPDLQISKCLQLIKGNSSRWIHESFESFRDFEWQEGYAAFTVGISGVERTIAYIRNQAVHHKEVSFQEEFISFLKLHSIEYDPKFVFG